jgi:hypothetical protein
MKRSCLLIALAVASACKPGERTTPQVLGLSFAVPAAELRSFLPPGAKPTSYPIAGVYGYSLIYPNPGNWNVLVQEDAPELLTEPRVFLIHTSRPLGKDCTRDDTMALADTLSGLYAAGFDGLYATEEKDERGYAVVAASERRMLTVAVRCYIGTILAAFTYFDLDRYRYRDEPAIKTAIERSRLDAQAFGKRKFR